LRQGANRAMASFQVPENINFPHEEENVAEHWKNIDAFQASLKQSKGKPRYTFYDGPPFATGLPHYGHILAGTIKDTVTRYAHQTGHHVERRFGWDTHGLPVEYEIDKTLGITGPQDVEKMGIQAYNDECRKIVMRYANEWRQVVTRLGRWIDFDNDYKTLYPWFMESVWWVFKELFSKGLVYKGYKVMPFSTACSTPLSNFESGQNYKDVVDPAVVVRFPLLDKGDEGVSMVAWTTTPWTLPSNLALCVNPEKDYVKVREKESGTVYILMEARICELYKDADAYEVLGKFKGQVLEGKRYEPLFDYFASMESRGAFRILVDGYVTEDSGTGVVHQAPGFGEDDFRVSMRYGIVRKDEPAICPVDASGRFSHEVIDFKGLHVKEADKHIVKMLKEKTKLVKQGTVNHSYPFCWRSETPLIYKAVPSWFVRVESMVESLLENNSKTYWVPDFVKEKRFANWLRDARDWAISRNRYWGTPIPLWISPDGLEVVAIGSIAELEELAGVKVADLHRETVDKIEIPSARPGFPPLRRIPEVFDCWFESGSMPYAQSHYPFENKKEFEDAFPADFIAEGVDQTRGWFYTLLVLGTALFGKPPFQNLIVNGLVLAADGQKMSKRKKNYPDPMEIINKYGADALRLYLINSPVVRAETLRFKEEGVRNVLKDVFLPWYNAFRFLMQNIYRLGKEDGIAFTFDESTVVPSDNYMDKWILSFTQSLVKFITKEMAAYRLYTVVPRLVKFVDILTNWYVRSNRKRLKGEAGRTDCLRSLETLFGVILTMVKMMAPFVPFLTEHMYQKLRMLLDSEAPAYKGVDLRSVHFLSFPTPKESLIDSEIEAAVAKMQTVIELGRVIRDRNTMPIKYPLKQVIVVMETEEALKDVQTLSNFIKDELNVKETVTTTDKAKYGVKLVAQPDHKTLGLKLKGAFKGMIPKIQALGDVDLVAFQKNGFVDIDGHRLEAEDIRISYSFAGGDSNGTSKEKSPGPEYSAHSEGDILVILDVSPDQSMIDEGVAREVVNRMQKLRKKGKLVPTDPVTIHWFTDDAALAALIAAHKSFIETSIKQPISVSLVPAGETIIVKETTQLKTASLDLIIVSRTEGGGGGGATASASTKPSSSLSPPAAGRKPRTVSVHFAEPLPPTGPPVCDFVNLVQTRENGEETRATLLLENPKGKSMTLATLGRQLGLVLGVADVRTLEVRDKEVNGTRTLAVTSSSSSSSSDGRSNGFDKIPAKKARTSDSAESFCRYVNVCYMGGPEKNGQFPCATLMLENPVESRQITADVIKAEIAKIFGVFNGKKLEFYLDVAKSKALAGSERVNDLHKRTIYVH